MADVLIIDLHADEYELALRAKHPAATFHSCATEAEAGSYLEHTEILITMGKGLTPEVVAGMPRLRWVQSLLVGVEHFIRALAGRDEVILTSTRGIHGPQMTEMAILHMLVTGRGVRRMMRNQERHVWKQWEQPSLMGKTVGILGVGAAGSEIACLCKALGMTVHGIVRTPRVVAGVDRFLAVEDLADAVRELDFLVVAIPYGPETDGLVDSSVIAAMKSTAILVNLARGGVVDEEALVDALRNGRIGGAGLDVFATEPLPADSPLWDLENVFVTPHLAGWSDLYVEQALTVVEPNLGEYLAGRFDRLRNLVER